MNDVPLKCIIYDMLDVRKLKYLHTNKNLSSAANSEKDRKSQDPNRIPFWWPFYTML